MIYSPPMPRTRRDPAGNVLPLHMHWKHGQYWHVVTRRKPAWMPLGKDYAPALARWAALEGGEFAPQTVGDAWAVYRASQRGLLALKPSTQRQYAGVFERAGNGLLVVFGDQPLDHVRRGEVLAWLEKREAAGKATAGNRDIAAMAAVYRFARDRDWTTNDPCKVKKNREVPRERTATQGERSAMNLAMPTLWRCIIVVALLTGLRQSEIRLLRRDHLSEDGIRPDRLKGGKGGYRWSPLLRQAINTALELQPKQRPSMYVFPGPMTKGQPYTADGFRTMWDKYRKRAGIDGLTFHDLRRTAGNDARSLEHAQALLGHRSAAVTARHYRPDALEDPNG